MFGIENADYLNIVYIVLAIGAGWILLRFLFKLARKIFMIGCVSIVVIGVILFISQYLQGG
jgi:hypothetical protein